MMTAQEIAHRDRMDSIRATLSAQQNRTADCACPICGSREAMTFGFGDRPTCEQPACIYARAQVRAATFSHPGRTV